MNRREMLKMAVAAAGGAALPGNSQPAAAALLPHAPDERPHNIIFMVADGMSPGVPALAEAFSQIVRNVGTHWQRLARRHDVVHGQFDMASLNSLVPDSAAASSAWGSGSLVHNGAINVLPDGAALTPIAPLAKDSGRRTGLVTTTRITHATPAGFAAVARSRASEDDIAPQYLESIDVLLGGGSRHFSPGSRQDERDVLAMYSAKGYTLFDTRAELLKAGSSERIVGLFDRSHLPYTIDRNRVPAIQRHVPTLAEMTRVALQSLAGGGNGFLLQIEGGRVDHAAHANDAAGLLWEQLAFDDAIGEVLNFCAEQPQTLVVITTDHGCGNPGLNGMGRHYARSNEHFARLAAATASMETLDARLKQRARAAGRLTSDHVRQLVSEDTGIEISEAHAAVIADVVAGQPAPELNNLEAGLTGVLAQILGNHTGIGWTGDAHTSDWAPILAFGPGSERFHGLLASTDAFDRMTELMNIEHRNPKVQGRNAMADDAVLVQTR